MNESPLTSAQQARLTRLAARASIAVALLLVVGKLATWFATGSVAILSSLVDSSMDVAASLVTFVSVRHAAKPADPGHRYGHGKAEALGALVQAGFVAGSALLLAFESIGRLIEPQAISHSIIGVYVMLGAIALTLALVALQRAVIARTGSIAIVADSLHYKSDLLMNAAVIAALLITDATGWLLADPLFGLAVVPVLLRSAYTVGRHTLDVLMDHELVEADRASIQTTLLEHPDVRGVHDLRTRHGGSRVFIEAHLELDPHISLARAHRISREAELRVLLAFPNADVMIHEDPAGLEEERLDHRVDSERP